MFAVGSVLIDAAVAGRPGQHALGSIGETYQMLKSGPVVALSNVALSLEKWFPVGASIGLTNPPGPDVLAPAAAGAVLVGYAVAMLVAASRTTLRRDIG